MIVLIEANSKLDYSGITKIVTSITIFISIIHLIWRIIMQCI